ncbi:MAG: sodium:solute symporter [Saprospiraceae bacterium]|nr:sodium:solute symporter [Saprospiraceae bacterium]
MIQQLTPGILLTVISIYFIALFVISYFTGKDASNKNFFLAGKRTPWPLVAYAMIGTSISGVTFISIPGAVGGSGLNKDFSYMQVVFGYMLGYAVIALVLMPIYYRMNLTSIYGYLEKRFGFYSYKTGAAYFLLSRSVGSAFRLFLAIIVLQEFVMGYFGIPFWLTALIALTLIWLYTVRGGIHTVIWTDTFQTTCFLLALIITIVAIGQTLGMNFWDLMGMVQKSDYSQMFFFKGGWSDPNNFFKQFISGALITITMTGLDQDMMQKNLSCKTIGDAQKNMFSFSVTLLFVNILFLSLGALLYIYASNIGIEIPAKTDYLYPTIAFKHLPPIMGIVFILGLIAATYASSDSALTALTTSFCVDFLNFEKTEEPEQLQQRKRFYVHIGMTLLLFVIIMIFNIINNEAVINGLFKAAGYTYGPLLGLYTFGILTKRPIKDNLVIPICIAAPIISFFLDRYSAQLFGGFQLGFLILAVNGLLTFIGLWAISNPPNTTKENT